MKMRTFFKYEMFLVVGIAMAGLSLIKLLGFYDFSSDWLWFIAGVGLMIEAFISLVKQKTFDKKYKVVLRQEVN